MEATLLGCKMICVRFEEGQAVKRRRLEATQSSNGIQNRQSNASSDVLCTADNRGSDGNKEKYYNKC